MAVDEDFKSSLLCHMTVRLNLVGGVDFKSSLFDDCGT